MKFIEVNQIGGLEIGKMMINIEAIDTIQQPNKGHCIIATNDGQKYLVSEEYSDVIETLRKILDC